MFIWTSQTTYNVTPNVSAIYITPLPQPSLKQINRLGLDLLRHTKWFRSRDLFFLILHWSWSHRQMNRWKSSPRQHRKTRIPALVDTSGNCFHFPRSNTFCWTWASLFMIVSISSLVTSSVPRLVSVRRIIILFYFTFSAVFHPNICISLTDC